MFTSNVRFQILRQTRRAYQKIDEISRLIERQLRQLNRNAELQNRANRIKNKKARRKRNLKKKRTTKNEKIKIDDIVVDQIRLNVFVMKFIIDTMNNIKFLSKHQEVVVIDSNFSKTTNENWKWKRNDDDFMNNIFDDIMLQFEINVMIVVESSSQQRSKFIRLNRQRLSLTNSDFNDKKLNNLFTQKFRKFLDWTLLFAHWVFFETQRFNCKNVFSNSKYHICHSKHA